MNLFLPFLPNADDNRVIPKHCSGVYIFCLREGSKLPYFGHKITYKKFHKLNVLYIGISENLYKRLNRQHLKNKGVSTFRKSIGVLHEYNQILRSLKPGNTKTRFSDANEKELTDWIRRNTIIYYYATDDPQILEERLIGRFRPPVNLKGNTDTKNKVFRDALVQLRKYAPESSQKVAATA